MTNYQEVRTTQQEPGREQRQFTFQATQLIWLGLGLLEGLFALRLFLKLIGANAANGFAALLYSFTDLFLMPFVGLTSTPAAGGMVLEISTLIAMVVYALAAWVLERIVWVIFYRPRTAAVNTQTTTTKSHTP
jgi:YggT family protein